MIASMIEACFAATLLMLLVLAVRKPVAQLFGAEWAYALWLLPAIIPFLPPLPVLAPIEVTEMTVILPAVDQMNAATAGATGSGDWLLVLLALWAGGAAVFATWQQSTYSAFMLHLGPEGEEAVPPSFGGIKVVTSDAVEGPIALGLFQRRIVVPQDFGTRYSPTERRLALEHELVHHRRFDLFWNWLALAMLTLNWFNPIAHFAFRAFRADQELACDAAVTRRSPGERHDYACALVKAASQPDLVAVCPLNHAGFLKRRLKMMKQHRSSRARTFGGLVSLVLIGGAGLALGGPGFAHEEKVALNVVRQAPAAALAEAAKDIAKPGEECGSAGKAAACAGAAASPAEAPIILVEASRSRKPQVKQPREHREALAQVREEVAEARAEAVAALEREPVEDVRLAVEAAQVELAAAQVERTKQVKVLLARIGAEMPRVRLNHALASAGPRSTHGHMVRVQLTEADRSEIKAAIAEANREVAHARIERIIEAELERALKPLEDLD